MKCHNCKHPRWAEEYPGRPFFGWCDEINDSPDMDIERECRCFEPATNAELIRRMSDEELAEFLAEEQYRIANVVFQACGIGLEKQVIYARRLDWLQQPAEEDT